MTHAVGYRHDGAVHRPALMSSCVAGDAAALTEMWLFGGNYPTVQACVGDTLAFVYESTHNVYSLDNGAPSWLSLLQDHSAFVLSM